eukprot:8890132-Prorocentrum_lima.AAC.1
MTSSLVGSEMCIRDRSLTTKSDVATSEEMDVSVGLRRGVTLRRGGEPVSYTHLTLPTICSV